MKWQPTVQGWQNLVLAVMGIVVLAGAIAGAFLLNRTDAVSQELNRQRPACAGRGVPTAGGIA